MSTTTRPLVVGNWKMHGLRSALAEITAIRDAVAAGRAGAADVAICPPATLIAAAADICRGSRVAIGGQASHAKPQGAHTGEISAEMLKDAGASFVLVGHSERRTDHAETDAVVRVKTEAATRAGLTAIVCVGETRREREEGRTLAILGRQIENSIPAAVALDAIAVAYEPVWAIGTGLTPSPGDVAEAHAFIREGLDKLAPGQGRALRILYGGSVKPANAAQLLTIPNVGGALVGGASLTCADFMAIAAVYR